MEGEISPELIEYLQKVAGGVEAIDDEEEELIEVTKSDWLWKSSYEVEFIALDGNTIAVETMEAEKIRPIRAREMPHVRDRAAA